MTGYNIRLNGDGGLIYKLTDFSVSEFETTRILSIQSADFNTLKQAFSSLTLLEIFKNDTPLASYTCYDKFENISYVGTVFVPLENKFSECIKVTLTKTNIVEQVDRLNKQINPVVDTTTMTLAQAKAYKIDQIRAACQEDIYAGQIIETSLGSHLYKYDPESQIDLDSMITLVNLCKLYGIDDVKKLPWHWHAGACQLMDVTDLFTIYMTLKTMLVAKTTYGNLLQRAINEMTNKDQILEVNYGDPLPPRYQDILNEINAETLTAVTKFKEKIEPLQSPTQESPESDEEPTEEEI